MNVGMVSQLKRGPMHVAHGGIKPIDVPTRSEKTMTNWLLPALLDCDNSEDSSRSSTWRAALLGRQWSE
jgi:hypothetical protein